MNKKKTILFLAGDGIGPEVSSSAKSILELSQEDLIKRTDLEEETIKEVIKILNEEFDLK